MKVEQGVKVYIVGKEANWEDTFRNGDEHIVQVTQQPYSNRTKHATVYKGYEHICTSRAKKHALNIARLLNNQHCKEVGHG